MSEAVAQADPGQGASTAAGPSIDSIISKVMGTQEAKAEAKPAAAPEPAEEAASAGEPESLDIEQEAVQASEESPAPAAKQKGSEELRKARETAKRAGLTESAVASMSEADLLAFARAKAKNDADIQRVFQENAELRRQTEEAKQKVAQAEPEKVPAAPEPELDPLLVEELGEQGARALNSAVAKKVAALETRLRAAEAAVQAAEAKAQEQQVRALFDAMQGSGEFGPTSPEYAQVLEKATALSRADGLYAGLAGEERARAIFRDAAKLIPTASPPSSPEPPAEKAAAKTATVTRVPQRTTRQQATGSPDGSVDRMIAAVLRGETDPAAIARKYG